MHFAHSGRQADRTDWQPLVQHLEQVAALAAQRGAPLGLEAAARCAGLLHDLGKYHPLFQRRLSDPSVRIDHSTAGGAFLGRHTAPAAGAADQRIAAEVIAYCILGHHAGLPDKTGGEASLSRRLERYDQQLDDVWQREITFDLSPVPAEIAARLAPSSAGVDLSLVVRMLFSCLVDADFRDTEAFYAAIEGRIIDRDWPELTSCLPAFRRAFDKAVAAKADGTPLNRLRGEILAHVRAKAHAPPGLFTLTVPTGGGKTLASLGFALDHAAIHGHRRIIYAIPFTSIIDQTAAIFRAILGAEHVLEHHSAIEDEGEADAEAPDAYGGRRKLRLAMEDWAAPVVVTTNVQFFESLFAARPSRARKLHNIAGSVIILDEAQTIPRPLLLPCLAVLDCLARHWRCSIVLCTATQPAVDAGRLRGGLPLEGRELAPDPKGLAARLRRARIVDAGEMDDEALVAALAEADQALVVVNGRAHALDLFRRAVAAGLEGLIHLTTRQYAVHRQEIIGEVRRRLAAGAPCRLVATSLVEAGVDIDFPLVWRARAGLEQIVQAAGRCNREGKRPIEMSIVTVFEPRKHKPPREIGLLISDMERMWAEHGDDPLSLEAMEAYFREVYWRLGPEGLDGKRILSRLKAPTRIAGTDFAFRSIAADFRMIESGMVPVVIPRGDAAAHVSRLGDPALPSSVLARALQRHLVLVPPKARQRLLACGKAHFAHPPLRGNQFVLLDDPSLYREDVGLLWEDAEYIDTDTLSV